MQRISYNITGANEASLEINQKNYRFIIAFNHHHSGYRGSSIDGTTWIRVSALKEPQFDVDDEGEPIVSEVWRISEFYISAVGRSHKILQNKDRLRPIFNQIENILDWSDNFSRLFYYLLHLPDHYLFYDVYDDVRLAKDRLEILESRLKEESS